jgi:hypothetical protein
MAKKTRESAKLNSTGEMTINKKAGEWNLLKLGKY